MTINRTLWDITSVKSFPKWPCPICSSGQLCSVKSNEATIIRKQTERSIADCKKEGWHPYNVSEKFAAFLACDGCDEIVVVSGDGYLEIDYADIDQSCYPVFAPITIYPAPPLFPIPNECSKTIKRELPKSFSHFWADTSACANSMRRVVETLMDDQKVDKKGTNKKGEEYTLSLHARIEKFQTKNADAGELLLAVKWLGNNGSHTATNEFSKAELLDGFEVLEKAVELIYGKGDKRINDLAKAIIANKGKPATK